MFFKAIEMVYETRDYWPVLYPSVHCNWGATARGSSAIALAGIGGGLERANLNGLLHFDAALGRNKLKLIFF